MQAATEDDSEEEKLAICGGTCWNRGRLSRACVDEVEKFQVRHLYIGRGGPHLNRDGSFWANPFKVREGGRKQSTTQYEDHVRKKESMLERIHQLEDKALLCHCRVEEACRTDVLIKLFEERV